MTGDPGTLDFGFWPWDDIPQLGSAREQARVGDRGAIDRSESTGRLVGRIQSAMHPRLDARSQLESTVGDAGQPSSEYVLVVGAAAGIKVRLRYVIVDAEPNVRLVAAVSRDGKNHGEQRAEIWPNREGTLLRWTVTAPGGILPPTRRLLAVVMARHLRTWLLAVEREALVESL